MFESCQDSDVDGSEFPGSKGSVLIKLWSFCGVEEAWYADTGVLISVPVFTAVTRLYYLWLDVSCGLVYNLQWVCPFVSWGYL